MKWSEVLPKEALDISVKLESRAIEERKSGKIIYPPQD